MTSPRFFVAGGLGAAGVGAEVALPDEVAHHAARVLRLAPGAAITLFDGTGGEYRATLASIGRHGAKASLDAFDAVERESSLAVTLVQAVLATDAMDYALRKAVELGVAAIAPLAASRSQALAAEKSAKRLAHWRAIAIAACEQCGRNRVPAVLSPQSLDEWTRSFDPASGSAAIALPGAEQSLAAMASRAPPRNLLIGPEGGFTEAEVSHALSRGVTPVHLGPRMLRAETAGVAALAMLSALAGDAR